MRGRGVLASQAGRELRRYARPSRTPFSAAISVNRRPNLTPDRRPILTPLKSTSPDHGARPVGAGGGEGASAGGVSVRSGFEAPAVVPGLEDVAVVGQAIQQRGGHLGVAEDAGPFAEGEIGGDDDGGRARSSRLTRWNRSCPPAWAKGR